MSCETWTGTLHQVLRNHTGTPPRSGFKVECIEGNAFVHPSLLDGSIAERCQGY